MSTVDARISPVLRYRDAAGALAWLERAYGFSLTEKFEAPDGSIVHAEMRCGPGAVGVSTATPGVDANPWSRVRSGVYICLRDVDAAYARAVGAGAEVLTPLADTSYGAREFSVRDAGGHFWSFGTYAMAAPEGPGSIYTVLHYDDGPGAVQWLEQAFGFAAPLIVPGANGVVVHAELTLGRDVLMLASAPQQDGVWGGLRQMTCAYVDDPDAHHRQAASARAQIVMAPHDTSYGARAYYTADPEGFVWGFSNYRPEGARVG